MWPVIDFVAAIASQWPAGGSLAEHGPDRLGLALVAERRRRAVRVDQVDLVGRHAAPLQRHLHRPCRAVAALDRLDHVPAVGRRAVADDLGVDASRRAPSRARGPRGTATPAPSPSTNPSRVLSNGRDTVCGSVRPAAATPGPRMLPKPAWATSSSGDLRRPGDHGDAIAAADRLGALGHVVRPGRAGGHDADVVADRPGLDRDHPGGRVDEAVGDERRGDARGPLLDAGSSSCRSSAAGRLPRSRRRRRPRSGWRR